MSVDYYMACGKCMKALHVAQDGLGGFTFYSGQPDTMNLLGGFLRDHSLCSSIMFLPDAAIERYNYAVMDSHGNPLPDD